METVEILKKIKKDYINNRFTFVEGFMMEKIIKYFGAKNEDLIKLKYSSENLYSDPTLPYRKSRNGRFLLDYKNFTISRLEYQPFILHNGEDFIRHDSETFRAFRGIQDDIQMNTAFIGLLRFQAYIMEGVKVKKRINIKDDSNKWISTVFHLRTITNKEIIGEPAKEGVHSDGVEHTMSTFLYSENMTEDSAISRIHLPEEKTGIKWDKVEERYIKGRVQHKHFLDTLLIIDNELKHSVSDVKPFDKEEDALRDMLIFFTRRQKSEIHPSFKNDTMKEHKELPLKIKLC